jgi:phosphorylcholine metabolism protein LicD
MLKVPIKCNKRSAKCLIYDWDLGDKFEEVENLEEPVRIRQMNSCCIKHLREILWYLADLFEEQEIPYWVDFGTLLGAIRGGRSIPHDTDGDLCLFMEHREKVLSLKDRVRKDGFALNYIKPAKPEDTHIKVCRSKKNFMIVDLFFWTHDLKNKVYRSDGLNEPKSFPDWWLEKKEKIILFDKEMWAPREPDKFLEMRFGSDWRVPQNKKVHFHDATKAHLFGFVYAGQNGWKKESGLTL